MKYLILAILSTLLAQSFGQEQVEAGVPGVNQNVVLLGSNLQSNNNAVWKKLISLAGGPGVAQFGVIFAAALPTSKSTESTRVVANLLAAGAKSAVVIPVTKGGAFDNAIVTKVKNTTGIFIVEDTDAVAPATVSTSTCSCINEFFFPGGVPSISLPQPAGTVCYEQSAFNRKNLIDTLRPQTLNNSLVLAAIRSVITNGGVVAGNAAALGNSTVILDGDALSSLVIGSRSFYSFPRTPLSLNNRGLALINSSLIIENGVRESGRETRLMRALLSSNLNFGIGLDDNMALVVNDPFNATIGQVVTPVGSTAGVIFMNVSGIPAASAIYNAFYPNVSISLASVNDTINLKTGNITFAPFKTNISGAEWFPNATASSDILSLVTPGQWSYTARYLIDCLDMNVTSTSPASLMPSRPAVQVYLDRNSSIGFGGDMMDDPARTYVVSYVNMLATVKVLGVTPSGK